MDYLFSITCPTCNKRITVRDDAAIGKILNCPSCKSMVLIEAPADYQPLPAQTNAPPADAERTSTARRPEAKDLSSSDEFSEIKSLTESPSVESPSTSENLPATTTLEATAATLQPELQSPEDAAYGDPLIPSEAWISNKTQQRRKVMLIACGALAGIGAVVLGVNLAISAFSANPEVAHNDPNQTQNSPPTNIEALADPETPGSNLETPRTPQQEPPEEAPLISTTPEAPAPGTVIPPAIPPTAVPGPPPGTENKPPTELPQVITTPPEQPNTEDPKPLISAPPLENEAPPTAPPGFESEPRINNEPVENTGSALDDLLNRFAPYLSDSAPTSEVTEPPSTADELPSNIRMDDASLPRPEPREIDVEARLADQIPAIQFQAIPLMDAIQFLSDFSTIPITIDVEALRWVGKSPLTPVSAQKVDVTVEGILNECLAPHRLAFLKLDDQIVITRGSEYHGASRSVPHQVSDLAPSEADKEELKEWIEQTVYPASWKEQGGNGSLSITGETLTAEQIEPVQFEVLRLLETLRIARGLPLGTKLPRELFERNSKYVLSQESLQKPVSINYGQSTRLLKILNELQKMTKVQLLVDWRSVQAIGWTLESEASVAVQGSTLEQTLTQLLRPMDLAFRRVGPATMQIVAAADLNQNLEMEIYDVSNMVSADDTAESATAKFGKMIGEHLLQPFGGTGALVYDQQSQSLIATLAQPHQIMLEQALAKHATVE